eukprot:752280-Hanusia_phi.AAC.1
MWSGREAPCLKLRVRVPPCCAEHEIDLVLGGKQHVGKTEGSERRGGERSERVERRGGERRMARWRWDEKGREREKGSGKRSC